MSCITGIASDIINDCTLAPVAGVEETMYVFNKEELTAVKSLTNDNLVTDLTVIIGKKGFKVKGFKKSSNAKSTLVVTDTLPDMYTQTMEFTVWGKDAETVKELKQLNNVVFVVEKKDKGASGDSAFAMYGYETGLFKATLEQDSNADGGVFKVSMVAEGQSTPYFNVYDTSYATTKAMLEALLVVQV